MPAKQNRKKQLDAFRAGQEQEAAATRQLCSHLLFWKACGHKKCLRARACVVDSRACFGRFWPLVPEELKISIRTTIKASTGQTVAGRNRSRDRTRTGALARNNGAPRSAASGGRTGAAIAADRACRAKSSRIKPARVRSPGARAMMATMRYAFAIPFLVITGHSRSKNGVASLAYVPVITLRGA